jgi:hypothetical protein
MTTCSICHRPDPSGAYACAACQGGLHAALTELRHQVPLLRASLQPGASPRTGATTGGRASAPLPVREDVLSLLGPAPPGTVHGTREDQTGPVPILAVLRDWCQAIAAEQRRAPPGLPTVEACTEYLADRLTWVCGREWVAQFHAELHGLLRTVRSITRSEPRTRLLPAPCLCGAFALTERDWAEYITCAVCRRWLTREQYGRHAAQVLPPLYRLGLLIIAARTTPGPGGQEPGRATVGPL